MKSLLLLLLLSCPGLAVTVALEDVPAYVRRHNRDLQAAQFRIDEARGRLLGAGRLKNPEFSTEYLRATKTPEWTWTLALEQRFPVTNRLRLEKAVTAAQLKAAEAEVREKHRQLASQAKSAAVRWLAIEGKRGVAQRQIETGKELSSFTERRLAVGEANAADVTQITIDTQQLETELLQLDAERLALEGELRPLLGVNATEKVRITGSLADLKTQRGAGSRPDVDVARAQAEAARRNVELARAGRWEDIGVGLMAEVERSMDAPDGYDRETMIGFRLSIPLPIWNRNQGPIAEAQAAAKRADREVSALNFSIASERAGTRDQMELLGKVVKDIQTGLLPKAREIEAQLRGFYAAGQSSLDDVMRARDRRLLIERQLSDALRDYHLARVRYETALGFR